MLIEEDYKLKSEEEGIILELLNEEIGKNQALIRSIKRMSFIKTSIIKNNYRNIKISNRKVKEINTLERIEKKKIEISEESKMNFFLNMIEQLSYLINEEKQSICVLNKNNILNIENNWIYVSSKDLGVIENNKIAVNRVYEKDKSIDERLQKIKELPSVVDYRTIYHNLACVTLKIIFKKGVEESIELLENLEGSKLYYNIKRCLNKELEDRNILWV